MPSNKAQTILVYAALIMIVALALAAMSKYLARSVQGKYRESADVFGGGSQYAPGVTTITH